MNKLKDIYKELKKFSWVKTNDEWDYIVFNGKKYSLDSPTENLYEVVKQYNKTLTLSKVDRLKVLHYVLEEAKKLSFKPICATQKYHTVCELVNDFLKLDGKHLKTDELDNKGKKELYLNVCGVQHQFNLELDKFIKRIEEKINKEYTSQRTKDAADGNDWKALSHAIRVLLEVKQLLEDGTITFPCIENRFLLRIKQGKINREVIDEFFNKQLSNILEKVKLNELGWKYDEEFWNEFILNEVKNGI